MTESINRREKARPRVLAALQKAFFRGALGHRLSSPCAPEFEPLLDTWLEKHGGETFSGIGETLLADGKPDERIIGVFGCFCEECLPLVTKFVLAARVDLKAQGAGDVDWLWTPDQRVMAGDPRTLSLAEAETESRIVELCCTLSLAMCEDAAVKVAAQVAQQVSREVARSTAQEVARQIADGYAKGALRKQLLINSAFQEQAAMLNHNSDGS